TGLLIFTNGYPASAGLADQPILSLFINGCHSAASAHRRGTKRSGADTAFITTPISWCLSRVIRGAQRSGVESISRRLSASVLKDFSFWMLRGYRLRFFSPTLVPSLSAGGRTRRETHNNEFGQFP